MTRNFSQAKRIAVLLDTLMGEHHVRHPLLRELTDELAATGLIDAARAARHLASDDPEKMIDDVFVARVRALAELVQATTAGTTSVTTED